MKYFTSHKGLQKYLNGFQWLKVSIVTENTERFLNFLNKQKNIDVENSTYLYSAGRQKPSRTIN